MKITVKEFVTPKEAEDLVCSLTGLGGFVEGHKWKEYLACFDKKAYPYLEALKDYIIKNDIRISGVQHASENYVDFEGTPVFSDNTYVAFSTRAWADLMAAIHNEKENTTKYNYMDFYFCFDD